MGITNPRVVGSIAGLQMPTFATICADFTTKELQQYVSYLRSPATTRLAELNIAAVAAIVKNSIEEFRRSLPPR